MIASAWILRLAGAAAALHLVAAVALASPSLQALPAAALAPAPGTDFGPPRERCASVPRRDCLIDVAALIASRIADPGSRGYSLAACAAAATGGDAERHLRAAAEAERLLGDGADGHVARASLRARLGDFAAARSSASSVVDPARRALAFVAVGAAALEASAREEGEQALREAFASALSIPDPLQRAIGLAALAEPSIRLGDQGLAREVVRLSGLATGEIGDRWMRALASARLAEARAVAGDAAGAISLALEVSDAAARERGLSRVAGALATFTPGEARRAADALVEPLARADAFAALAAAEATRSREAAASLLQEARSLVSRVSGVDRYDFALVLQRVAIAEISLGEHATAAGTLAIALGAIATIPEEHWRAQALGEIVTAIVALP